MAFNNTEELLAHYAAVKRRLNGQTLERNNISVKKQNVENAEGEELIKLICEQNNARIVDFYSTLRNEKMTRVRAIVVHRFFKKGLHPKEIASLMKRERTMVYHYLNSRNEKGAKLK